MLKILTEENMETKKYSAGMVKLSFWFAEFRKVADLLLLGKTMDEIRILNKEGNIFGAPTAARSTQIFNTVSTTLYMKFTGRN